MEQVLRSSPNILKEVLTGLSNIQKNLPAKLLYDKKGSEFFEKICLQKEYYPKRSEVEILQKFGQEISDLIGPEVLIIEPGSGSGEKIRFLLSHLEKILAYVPIEISENTLKEMEIELTLEHPMLSVYPISGDFNQVIEWPQKLHSFRGKSVIFFPGSTIGNFSPKEAISFLKKCCKWPGQEMAFLIGVDLKKDSSILEQAYDDSDGVTASFNLNLLERINREACACFDLNKFKHHAIYNEEFGRVEMHLVSQFDQFVKVNQSVFKFKKGESIHTESSYKYTVDEFVALCRKAKLTMKKHWKDSQGFFCVYYLEKE